MPRACSSPRTRRRTSREPSSSSTADIWRSERCASRRTSRGWGPAVRGEPIRDGMADEASFDRAKAKAFTMLMVRHLEGAAVSIMLEVGRRVGLFEAMAKMGAVTSAEIAERTGLSERYIREWLEAGIRVADVGCGTGHCIALMARRFPKSTFVGYDFSEDGIAEARAAARGLANASFVVQDVSRLESPAPFDLMTAFDAIHDQ